MEAAKPQRILYLWVFSDAHVATDRAVSAAIRNGMEFVPPAGYPESLAHALRQSENGGELGGPAFRWDIALDLATMPAYGTCRTMRRARRWPANMARCARTSASRSIR